MTGMLCIAPWVAMVAAFFGIMIKAILPIVEKVGDNVQVPSSRFCTAGLPGLTWPCLSPPGLDMFLAAPVQIGGIAGVDRDVYPRPATRQRLSVSNQGRKRVYFRHVKVFYQITFRHVK